MSVAIHIESDDCTPITPHDTVLQVDDEGEAILEFSAFMQFEEGELDELNHTQTGTLVRHSGQLNILRGATFLKAHKLKTSTPEMIDLNWWSPSDSVKVDITVDGISSDFLNSLSRRLSSCYQLDMGVRFRTDSQHLTTGSEQQSINIFNQLYKTPQQQRCDNGWVCTQENAELCWHQASSAKQLLTYAPFKILQYEFYVTVRPKSLVIPPLMIAPKVSG